jgi:hypothetical protein
VIVSGGPAGMPMKPTDGRRTLGQRFRAARMRSFVGRDVERTLFRSALQGGEHAFSMLYIHGPGGTGKTTLLRVFADDARAAGRSVIEIDVRVTGADSPAFEAACGSAPTTDGVVLLVRLLRSEPGAGNVAANPFPTSIPLRCNHCHRRSIAAGPWLAN